MNESPRESLADWLAKEPFTLTLGSGFFGFFAHFGVLRALVEQGLVPAKLTGASSGALIAGCFAAGLSLSEIEQLLLGLRRADFWDPGLGLGLLKGRKFREKMRAIFPTTEFEQCVLPLRLSVYNAAARKTEVWQQGDLIDAIYASCALPILFQPLKRNGERFADGGVLDRPALQGLEQNERVLIHHLSSRSPWRAKNDPALIPPTRPYGQTLVIDHLIRVGPFKLENGPKALQTAYLETKRKLQLPIKNSV